MFDNIAYVHVPHEKRRKLNAKAEKCILVDYLDEQKGYKCYNPRTKQVRVSRNVVFNESLGINKDFKVRVSRNVVFNESLDTLEPHSSWRLDTCNESKLPNC